MEFQDTSLKTMHEARLLLTRLREQGVALRLTDGDLRVDDPKGAVTPETLETISGNVWPLIGAIIKEGHYNRIRNVLRMECERIGVLVELVDRLPESELDATDEQLGRAGHGPDGNGNSRLHSLAEFYLRQVEAQRPKCT